MILVANPAKLTRVASVTATPVVNRQLGAQLLDHRKATIVTPCLPPNINAVAFSSVNEQSDQLYNIYGGLNWVRPNGDPSWAQMFQRPNAQPSLFSGLLFNGFY